MASWKNFEDKFSIGRAALVIAVLGIASRLVGLLRDRMFASRFGAGDVLDVYYASFRIPDFLFNMLILGTLSAAFIPVFAELLAKDKSRAYRTANTVLNFSLLAMGAACLLLLLLSAPLTRLLVPGFSPEKYGQTLFLTRILLLSPIIFTASNFFGSLLNAQKRFIAANLAPLAYNAGIIFGLLALYPRFGISGLGIGVIVGALLHFFMQFAACVRLGFSWRPIIDSEDSAARRTGRLFLPRVLGLDASQVSLLAGSVIGSLLAPGTIAVLNLSFNLQAVPVGVFAVSLAAASFPLLAEQAAKKNHAEYVRTVGSTAGKILFFMIPVSVGVMVFRAYLVRLVYGAGNFGWNDTVATLDAVGIFGLSLFAQGLTPLLARAFFARQDTKTPLLVALCAMASNVGLAYFFSSGGLRPLAWIPWLDAGWQNGGAAGLALAFSLSSIIQCLMLFLLLRRQLALALPGPDQTLKEFDARLAQDAVKTAAAAAVFGLVSMGGIYLFEPLVDTRTFAGILLQSGLAGTLGLAAFVAAALALKIRHAEAIKIYARRLAQRLP